MHKPRLAERDGCFGSPTPNASGYHGNRAHELSRFAPRKERLSRSARRRSPGAHGFAIYDRASAQRKIIASVVRPCSELAVMPVGPEENLGSGEERLVRWAAASLRRHAANSNRVCRTGELSGWGLFAAVGLNPSSRKFAEISFASRLSASRIIEARGPARRGAGTAADRLSAVPCFFQLREILRVGRP
jgi:hypothetical protein